MVNVIGLGYIGLPTALMLAAHGVKVIGTDCNQELVDHLNRRKITFREKDLDGLFQQALANEIQFVTEYPIADIYIIAVPTPYDKFSKKIDTHYLLEALRDIIKVCPPKAIIAIESTISPGTIDKIVQPFLQANGFVIGEDIYLAHVPERIIPGNMVHELIHNNRIIGVDNNVIGEKVKELYSSFCQGDIAVTSIKAAEMAKIMENSFRAVNIAFANELAKICRYEEMDVYELIRICNMHPRVNILNPGPGVGGHCIPVDPWFLVGDYPSLALMISEAMNVNHSMPEFVLERIYSIMSIEGITDTSRVGLYGITYKEDVDDFRESPTLQLLECQTRHLAEPLKTYDPLICRDLVKNQYHDLEAFLNDIDFIVIMVAHQEIKAKTELLRGKVVLDTRNCCHLPGSYTL